MIIKSWYSASWLVRPESGSTLISSRPLITNDTSAMPNGLRNSVPLKMTSSIFSLRESSCSVRRVPKNGVDHIALAAAFGPTTPHPSGNSILASANDLNPTFKRLEIHAHSFCDRSFRCVRGARTGY